MQKLPLKVSLKQHSKQLNSDWSNDMGRRLAVLPKMIMFLCLLCTLSLVKLDQKLHIPLLFNIKVLNLDLRPSRYITSVNLSFNYNPEFRNLINPYTTFIKLKFLLIFHLICNKSKFLASLFKLVDN